jgi:hypothetical protein
MIYRRSIWRSVYSIILRRCRHHQYRHYHPRARCIRLRLVDTVTIDSAIAKAHYTFARPSQSIIEADIPALVIVIPAAKWKFSSVCQLSSVTFEGRKDVRKNPSNLSTPFLPPTPQWQRYSIPLQDITAVQ